MIKNLSILLAVAFLLFNSLSAQEVLKAAYVNNLLRLHTQQVVNQPRKRAITTPLSLPFIDDFSYPGPYPDSTKWVGRNVYINNTLPVDPPTIGVASLDGLNAYGQPFDTSGKLIQGGGDTLLSGHINLKGLHASDSVYLSFFYQSGGNGYSPESDDTLYLEFLSKSGNWRQIWSVPGPLYPGGPPPFKQVLFPIVADSFLDSAFQFRIREWCTISGFNDVFNIDYVKLDKHRNRHDTVLNDVAFQQLPSKILTHYTSMPWRQFYNYQNTEMQTAVQLYLRNNKLTTQSTNFRLKVRDVTSNTLLHATVNPAILIPGLTDVSNVQDTLHIKPAGKETASIVYPNDPAAAITIRTTCNIQAITADPVQRNDTCHRDTRFDNYLAYDDGSAEFIYGLVTTGAKLAYKFNVNQQDTIIAVAIHFQRHNSDVSKDLFSVIVWNSITPGSTKENIKYRKDYQTPQYTDSFNGFHYYFLDTPQIVNGSFYVGWQQSQADLLNVGFDANDTANKNIFFNTGSGWTQSIYPGALMIRPVFSRYNLLAGVDNIAGKPGSANLVVFPNPVQANLLNIRVPGNHLTHGTIEITDLVGRPVYNDVFSPVVDITQLPAGVYIVRVYNKDNNTSMLTKFVRQ